MFENLWRALVSGRKSARRAMLRLETLEERCLLSASVAISTNPIAKTIIAGQTVSFTAAATGSPTPTVLWEMNTPSNLTFTPVPASAPFSGVTTAKLTISNASASLSGDQFEAIFTNGVNPTPSATTSAAKLIVDADPAVSKLNHTVWTNKFAGFNGTMTVSGGIGSYSIVSDSGLPTGLTAVLSGNTISFTGTPTTVKAFTAGSITIEDSAGNEVTQTFSITINTAPSITHMSNNNWTAGLSSFNGAMTIDDGAAPFTIVSDSGLPSGVTAYISGDLIKFSGTPTIAKTFNPTITIKDAAGATASRNFVIAVDPALVIGNLTQNQWTVDEPGFTGSLVVGGGTGPFTLTASSGLPLGLVAKLSGTTITFTGTPTIIGTSSHGSVTVTDADGASITQTFSITVNPDPTVSGMTTTQWTAGETGLPDILTITGGTAPYSIAAYGNLPFTPAIGGNSVFFVGPSADSRTLTDGFVTIRDATGATFTDEFPPFVINLQPTISNLTNNQWTVGKSGFTGTLTIFNGTAPFTITDAQNLPTGMTAVVNGDTITFSGTPTVIRSFSSGSLTIEDSGDATLSVSININIHPGLTITNSSLPAVSDGVHYSTSLQPSGGVGPYTFAFAGGSLPTGITMNSNGVLAGTSNAVGVFPFSATVTDSIGDHFTQNFNLPISPAIAVGLQSEYQWTVNEPGFKSTMAIIGGGGTFSLGSTTGLPPGMTAALSGASIVITGTPTTVGTYSSGSISVNDSLGGSFTKNLTITIVNGPTLSNLSVTAWTGNVGAFPGIITISGGTAPYTIVSSHGIPFTPAVNGNTILFTGSAGGGTYSNGSITVRDLTGATVTESTAALTINPPPQILHMSVNNWTADEPGFNGTLPIEDGTAPFTIIDSKNLPPGLTPYINGDEIAFKGIPTSPRTYSNANITIEDAAGVLTSRTFVFDIAPALIFATTNLPAWRSGQNYSTVLQTTGGTGTITFAVTAGTLPSGITLNSNGKLHGVATGLATYTFTVTATDSTGDKVSETFTI